MRSDTKIRGRGRPRQYDPDDALEQALAIFWSKGFSATSLDDLAAATAMNRPSLYRAFGDKRSLYRKAFARFVAKLERAMEDALSGPGDLAEALGRFYAGALDVYLAAEPALGCFVMCTAPVEAPVHPEMREDLARVIGRIDDVLGRRFAAAGASRADAGRRARLAQAVLHSLAIRARAGASRAELAALADDAVARLGTAPRDAAGGSSQRRRPRRAPASESR